MKHLDSFRFAVLESTSLTTLRTALANLLRAVRQGAVRLVCVSIIGGAVLVPAQAHAFNLGKAINRAAINVGKTVHKAAHDTGRAVEKAAHDTGHAVEKAAGDTGHAVEKAAHDTGHAVEKAAGDTGRTLEKATHDTGHYIEKHPLEAALAVAMIGGGAYLIAFQDFNLVVQLGTKSVTLIQGGALNGALGAGAGAGGLAAGASTVSPRDGTKGSGGSGGGLVIATTLQKPLVPSGGAEPSTSTGAAAGAGQPGSPFGLAQPRPLSDFDARIKYSRDTLEWIRTERLLETFRAADHPVISPAEMRLQEAIRQISGIEDSAADKAAKAQAEKRDRFGLDALKGTVGRFPPVSLFDAMISRLARLEIEHTKLGDGQAAAREHHLRMLREQMEKFRVRRALQESAEPRGPIKLPEPPPSGPTWRAS